MTEEKASSVPFALAGLFVPVIAAWAALFLSGSLDRHWLLAGVLAIGAGMLVVNLLQRLLPQVFAVAAEPESEDAVGASSVGARHASPLQTPSADEDEAESDVPAPRLRVLAISSGLQALSVALLTGYFLHDVVIAAMAGLAFGALGMAVSVLLARNLSAPAQS